MSLLSVGIGVQGGLGARIEGNTVQGFSDGIRLAADGPVQIIRNQATDCQTGLTLLDLSGPSVRVPFGGTSNALVRNNRFTGCVLRPPRADATPNIVASGSGIVTNADNNRFVGNNIELNEIAGMTLMGDVTTPATRTATGNLILGNKNVVVGSTFVLTNNTISGSQTSAQNVGQALQELLLHGPPPFQ